MTPALALLFSLVAPGAGQILNGDFAQGILLGALFAFGKSVLLPLMLRILRVTRLKTTLQIFYIFNLGYMLLILYAAVESFVRGFFSTQFYFWPAVLCAVAVTLAQKNTFNAFVFTALCGRAGVYSILRKGKQTPTEKK